MGEPLHRPVEPSEEAPIAGPAELDDVRRANRAFYDAFEARDLDAMSEVWEHSARVVCTHPGWSTLRGWARVASSFFALFQGGQRLQFILTEEHPEVVGALAWVSVDENLIDAAGATTLSALNLFARGPDGRWRMVAHHASPVSGSPPSTP